MLGSSDIAVGRRSPLRKVNKRRLFDRVKKPYRFDGLTASLAIAWLDVGMCGRTWLQTLPSLCGILRGGVQMEC